MAVFTRRRFLQYGAAGGAALYLSRTAGTAARAATGPKLAKYVEPLPLPGAGIVVATPSGAIEYAFTQTRDRTATAS